MRCLQSWHYLALQLHLQPHLPLPLLLRLRLQLQLHFITCTLHYPTLHHMTLHYMRFSAVVAFVAYYIALKYNCSYHWNYYSHCHCYSGCSCSYSAHARTYYNHYMTLTAQYIAWRYCNRIHYITQIKSHYWAALQIRLHYTSIIRTHNHLHTWTCAWTHVKKKDVIFFIHMYFYQKNAYFAYKSDFKIQTHVCAHVLVYRGHLDIFGAWAPNNLRENTCSYISWITLQSFRL